jgi:hypothetical protein
MRIWICDARMARNHVSCNCRGWRSDTHRIAKDQQSTLLKAELRKDNLLRMVLIFGWMDEIESFNTGAELGREREDVSENLGLGLPSSRICRFDEVGRTFRGHGGGVGFDLQFERCR